MEKKKTSQKEEGYSLIPKKELRCVWMTAGLLSYKLCQHDLQCEKCPLDWELRNLSPASPVDSTGPQEPRSKGSAEADPDVSWQRGKWGEEFLREDLSLLNIKESLFYHPGHTWIKVEKADEVRVGLDTFLGSIIGKVNVVVLPLSGRRVLQGETLCSIIHEEGILHIVFPVGGVILSVNSKLKDQPELVTRDPLGDGFLLTLKPKNFQRDQKSLFCGEAALSWYRREWERFKTAVISELHHGQESLGMTMQDGEIRLKDIKKWIDPERYIQLISTFLRNGEKDSASSRYKRPSY
ncbi:MAG: glycine cleavage system protein H [Thermodesulfobacteriota bacterium]